MRGFLRSPEATRNVPIDEIGIRVAKWRQGLDDQGKPQPEILRSWFFPGSTEQTALILANVQLPPGVLTSDDTTVEFGFREGDAWKSLRVMKNSPLTARTAGAG